MMFQHSIRTYHRGTLAGTGYETRQDISVDWGMKDGDAVLRVSIHTSSFGPGLPRFKAPQVFATYEIPGKEVDELLRVIALGIKPK